MATSFIWLAIAVTVFYILVGAVFNYRKLSQFKGPRLAGFSELWMFWQEINARLEDAQAIVLDKYGSVCRIGPNLLTTNDADILRHVNAPRSKWRRTEWYDGMRFDPRQDSVLSTRDEKQHADLKAKETGAYSGRDIEDLEADIDLRTVDFMRLLKTHYNNKSMDFGPVARFYVLDVLSTVAFGTPFGFMASNKDLWDYNRIVGDFVAIIEFAANHAFFRRIIFSPTVQGLIGPKVTDKLGMGPAMGFARNAVAERFGTDPKIRNDMLGHFVRKGLTQRQCEVEGMLQILAGSDSTTAILRQTIFTIAGNQVAYRKLQDEIDSAIEAGKISHPVIKYSEAQKLTYLQACIWESFRMFPPLFGLAPKLAPPGGDTVKGIFFPEGAELAWCPDAMCKNKEVFGEDAEVYRPERWLEADEETRYRYERVAEGIFGFGRYACLGRHLAVMELNKVIAELFRNFNWVITHPLKGVTTWQHGATSQTGMFMIASPRN